MLVGKRGFGLQVTAGGRMCEGVACGALHQFLKGAVAGESQAGCGPSVSASQAERTSLAKRDLVALATDARLPPDFVKVG